jgi:hypothetical protein
MNGDAAGCANWRGVQRANTKAIPVSAHLRSRQAENLYSDPELKNAKPVIRQNRDITATTRHGRILAKNVISAYRILSFIGTE